MNPSLRYPVDPLACPECGVVYETAQDAFYCCAPAYAYPNVTLEPLDVEDEMTEAEREELLAGASETRDGGVHLRLHGPEEVYTQAVADYIEARRQVQEEELKRAEIELVAIEEIIAHGQAKSQTAAKEMKTLHPDYRAHKERLNALELAVTRAEALVEVRKAQLWRSVYATALAE